MDHRAGADPDARSDDGQRAHVNAFSQLRRRIDDGGGMDARPRRRLGMQDRDRAREREVGVGGEQARQRRFQLGGDDHGRGARGGEPRDVARVGDEGQVAGPGVFDPADPAHLDVAVAPEGTSEARGQVAKDHPASILPAGRGAGAATGVAGAWCRMKLPTLTEPLSCAPSRTAMVWASTVPSNRPFSSRTRLRTFSSPLNSPPISATSAVTTASTEDPSPIWRRPLSSISPLKRPRIWASLPRSFPSTLAWPSITVLLSAFIVASL